MGDKIRDEGRPMVLASEDGVSWNFLSYITPEHAYPPKIFPHPAILPDRKIVVALRAPLFHSFA